MNQCRIQLAQSADLGMLGSGILVLDGLEEKSRKSHEKGTLHQCGAHVRPLPGPLRQTHHVLGKPAVHHDQVLSQVLHDGQKRLFSVAEVVLQSWGLRQQQKQVQGAQREAFH